VSPHARRLDVVLRPAGGRHYPNLADHRTNVEYDIGRVLHTLHDDRFTPRRLSAEGRWVKVQLVGGQ
jgi:hypothetical protein